LAYDVKASGAGSQGFVAHLPGGGCRSAGQPCLLDESI
jgi:hypothetical protein